MTRHWTLATTLAVCLLFVIPADAALTNAARLAAVYDTILGAGFDRVDEQLREACPPAPPEACATLGAVSVWWQILITPDDPRLDARMNERASAAVAAADAWTRREPMRGEAWFYLAASYGPLVQWHVLRGERLAAVREGKKIKDALERALSLDPSIDDAHFGIGLYHYYADVAPPAAKFLRWLLFLPGGDRVKGLQEMLETRTKGVLLKGEADYQLHQVYLWYEKQPQRAIELLLELDRRYPANPVFLQKVADAQNVYLHDSRASAATWRTLIDRARAGRVYDAKGVETRARTALMRLGVT
jgi:hypothetical protein